MWDKMFKLNSFLITAIILIPLIAAGWDDADWNNGYNSGNAAGTAFGKKVDDPEKINTRFIQPLTSSGTLMQSFDGSVSFNGQLSAPSSDAFLEIMVAPAKTGDLTTVLLRQDTDFDGTPDYAYNVPVRISGICANGFISADAGSWNNLHYYTWETNPAGEVTIAEQTSILELTACYCINASCGSNLVWSSLGVVLRDIGAGVVSAIHKTNPDYAITDVDIADTTITYYGQDSQNMGAAGNVYAGGTTHPEVYTNTPEDITGAGEAEYNSQMNDADSYAYLVSSASDKTTSTINCVIWNDIQFTQDILHLTDNGTAHWPTDHFIDMRIIRNSNIIQFQWRGRNYGGGSSLCGPDGWQNTAVVDLFSSGLSFFSNINYYYHSHWSGWGCVSGNGTVTGINYTVASNGYCPAYGCQNPSADWNYSLDVTRDNPQLISNNTCGGIDDSCSLMEEKICSRGGNCVYTVKNFTPTGFTPYPFCESINTSIDSYTVCMDGSAATIVNSSNTSITLGSGNNVWWRIEKTYLCENFNTFNFDDAEERLNQINNTITDNGAALNYQDINTDTGEVTPYNIDLPPRTTPEACEKACKLRVPIQDTQAAESGHTAQYRISTNSYKEIVRRCWDDVCTVKAGETLIQDCTCLDYFVEAVSLMQAIDEAGSDMICSESAP